MHSSSSSFKALLTLASLALSQAACPFADPAAFAKRDEAPPADDHHLNQYHVNDGEGSFMTSDVGGPIADQDSLRAGRRGSTLLEDFIFRQKLQHFDHERVSCRSDDLSFVPERVVHARGAGAHGVFTSYADWSNLTAANFLSEAGKETPVFVRFSTVAGFRGSADTARDVHGFATRFYTDEGNFDIVGNNIPVFFIQDAIRFPDLIHSVKPEPNREIPQAATAHDSAWDFFSQQPSTMHTLFWAMAGNGIPRSYRHMDGFGVHTFRFVKDDGSTKLIKWHFKTKQGKASLVWEEAQVLAGKNADFHRQDLWDAIESGNGPEWELAVQVVDEDKALAFGFDLLDPTKIIPEELAPLVPLGIMKLNRNPTNYFAETEQSAFQPGHVVRGVDFTEDPLLQGRLFSYLDTQMNRHGGPNFEQVPINMPKRGVPIHNNNRDGFGQNFIHTNNYHYTPNTLNGGYPQQANQTHGRGFFTAPGRTVAGGNLVRELSPTFDDHWSQARLFLNSLTPVEQQFVINAIRFEASHLTNEQVKKNVLIQLNRVSNDVAKRVAVALGLDAPAPDPTFYHNNVTAGLSIFNETLPTIKTLRVGILVTTGNQASLDQAAALKGKLAADGLVVTVVAETLKAGVVDQTYSAADATGFDGVIIADGAEGLFDGSKKSPLYPAGRPGQIVVDGYRWGKPVGALGNAKGALESVNIPTENAAGVVLSGDVDGFVGGFEDALKADPNEYAPLTDDESMTQQGSIYEDEQAPFSWLEYSIFALIGMAMLWAWNMFLAAAPYFQSRFESDPWILANSQSAILTVSTLTNLLAMLILTNIQSSANYPFRINLALLLNALVFGFLTISTSYFLDSSPGTYFVFLLLMVCVTACASGLMQNGAFSFAASFGRTEYTQAIMAGQGVAGILPPLTQTLSYLAFAPSTSSPDPSASTEKEEQESSTAAFIYFLTAVIISIITLVAFVPLVTRHNRLIEHRLSVEQDLSQSVTSIEDAERASRRYVSIPTLFRKLKWVSASVFMSFVVTMFFPVFTAKILSVKTDDPESPRIFEPGAFIPLGFFFWNLGDLTGRVSTMLPFSLRHRPKWLFGISMMRWLFLPLYLLCNIGGKGAVVRSDLFYLVVVQVPFGLTNGWLGSSAMMAAGEWVSEWEREAAGGFMGMCLVAGLSVGSLLSFSVAGI
ncbi:catalase-like domain-containing protein [Podospora fimiseda]|uniref:catalase n=1 Tax=Podospora fimiseda TaxID=252190 RepID=A0AAN7H582_9PEZI|nr:catalase-like domain-containing protein [Podospora fimiseda]